MSIGTSMFLTAVGAILRYAVTERVAGVDLRTAGSILMLVGIAGLVIALLFAARGGFGGPRSDAP